MFTGAIPLISDRVTLNFPVFWSTICQIERNSKIFSKILYT